MASVVVSSGLKSAVPRWSWLLVVLLLFSGAGIGAASRSRKKPVVSPAPSTFEQQVRPILKANCFDCHGESEKPKGGLDLRLRRLIVQGGESGPAIEAGNPDKSLLLQKVIEGEMPKREKKLSAPEI